MSIADVNAARDGQDGTVATPDGPRASQPKRRTFTREYKMRILAQYESASSPQERNALLRREGIYSAYITEWRRERDRTESAPAPERKPGRPGKSPAETENERLRRENEKLAKELARTKAALEVVGKAHALCATRGRTLLSELADWRVDRCRSTA
jgi:transposase-like protein